MNVKRPKGIKLGYQVLMGEIEQPVSALSIDVIDTRCKDPHSADLAISCRSLARRNNLRSCQHARQNVKHLHS